MTDAAAMAASAAWLAKEHPDWGQQSTSAAQAAQINQAYLSNQLAVLPQYAAGGGARYTQAEIADAAAETAKHMEAFHPEQYYGVSPAALGGMTQEQIASRYGSRMAEHVSSYYVSHPSERYLATTAQYEAQRNRIVSVGAGGEASTYQAGVGWVSTPTDKGTAAAQIAREVGKTGGAVDVRLGFKTIAEGAKPSEVILPTTAYITRPTFQTEIQTTKEGQRISNQAWAGAPIRMNVAATDLITGTYKGSLETGIHTAAGDWGGLYTPEATKAGTSSQAPGRTTGENLVAELATTGYRVVDDEGKLANALKIYVPYGSYTQEELRNTKLAIDRSTGEVAIYQHNDRYGTWDLIGGGGRNALQSGMFSIGKPLTAFVTTQEGVGTYVTPEGAGLSRLGAESTGGFVKGLSNVNLLAPNEAVSRYYGAGTDINLANYVNQVAGGKAEAPGANIPWAVSPISPAIQEMGTMGIVKGSEISIPTSLLSGDIWKQPAWTFALSKDEWKKAPVMSAVPYGPTEQYPFGGTGAYVTSIEKYTPQTTTLPTTAGIPKQGYVSSIGTNNTSSNSEINMNTIALPKATPLDIAMDVVGRISHVSLEELPLALSSPIGVPSIVARNVISTITVPSQYYGLSKEDVIRATSESMKTEGAHEVGYVYGSNDNTLYNAIPGTSHSVNVGSSISVTSLLHPFDKFDVYHSHPGISTLSAVPSPEDLAVFKNDMQLPVVGRIPFIESITGLGRYVNTQNVISAYGTTEYQTSKSEISPKYLAGAYSASALADTSLERGKSIPYVMETVAASGEKLKFTPISEIEKSTPTALQTASAINIREAEAKAPFVSTSRAPYPAVTTEIIKPTGELFGFNLGPVSQAIAFFQPGKEVTTEKAVTMLPTVTTLAGTAVETLPETKTLKSTDVSYDAAGNKVTTYNYEVAGGTVTTKEFVTTGGKTTTTSTFEKSTPSGYESWLAGANKQVTQGLGFNLMPEVTTEQIKSTAPMLATTGALYGGIPIAMALQTPGISDYAASYIKGEVTAMKETPVNALVMTGAGIAMGGIFRGAEEIAGAGKAAIAAKVTEGSVPYKIVDVATGAAMKYGPQVLTGIYTIDVAGRATEWGKDFSSASAERLGGIISTETRPMTFGGVVGYKAPEIAGFAYRSVVATPGKVSEGIYGIQQKSMGIERISGEKPAYAYDVTPLTKAAPDIGERRMLEVYGTLSPRTEGKFEELRIPTERQSYDIGEAKMMEVYGTTTPRFVESYAKQIQTTPIEKPAYDIGEARLKEVYGTIEPRFVETFTKQAIRVPEERLSFDIGEARLAEAYREPSAWEQRQKVESITKANVDYINSIIRGEVTVKTPEVRRATPPEEKPAYDLSHLTYATMEPRTIEIPTAYDWNVARQMSGVSAPAPSAVTTRGELKPYLGETRPYWEVPSEFERASSLERTMADTFITTAAGTLRISKVPSSYTPAFENLPSIGADLFTYGSAMDTKAQRLIVTKETGEVVGATAYEVRGEDIFVKTMGSRYPDVGTTMATRLKDIAEQQKITRIIGESRPAAVGFWERIGAEVKAPSGEKTTYPFEMRIRETQDRQLPAAASFGFASAFGTTLIGKTTIVTPERNVWKDIISVPTQGRETKEETKPTTEQKVEPSSDVWKDTWKDTMVTTIKVPGGGLDLRSAAAGGGGGIGGGFKFTDIMQVKSAREVMFGKTPTKRRKPYKFI